MGIKRHIECSPLHPRYWSYWSNNLTTKQKKDAELLKSSGYKDQSAEYIYLALDIKHLEELYTKQLRFLEQALEEECIRNRQIQEQQEEIARLQNQVETYEIERRKYFSEQTAAQTAVQAVDEWIKVGGMD